MTDAIEYSDDVAAGPDLADALTQLWEQGHQPNVDEFLACHGALSPAERIELLLVDQTNRWRMGERIKAGEYLARHPDLRIQEESFIDLIYHEFPERESLGETPTSEEYARRFPSYATTLRAQIDFHRALQAAIESDARRRRVFVRLHRGDVPTANSRIYWLRCIRLWMPEQLRYRVELMLPPLRWPAITRCPGFRS